MHEEKCPGCDKELSLNPGSYPVAGFYGPAICSCQGPIKTFPEIAKIIQAKTVVLKPLNTEPDSELIFA